MQVDVNVKKVETNTPVHRLLTQTLLIPNPSESFISHV